MERRAAWAAFAAVLLLGNLQVTVQAGTRLVSAGQIHVSGANHFSCDEIGEKLATSLLNQKALSPKSPVEDVPKFFEEQILRNYRRSGFLDVSVRTEVDHAAGEYRLQITEGCQYLAGEIEVTGLPESDVEPFLKALMSPGVPPTAVIAGFRWREGNWKPQWTDGAGDTVEPKRSNWTIGKPVCVHDRQKAAIADELQRALAAIGRLTAESEIGDMEREGTTVRFPLVIRELGPPLVGRNLEILGCRKNTPDDIRQFLHVDADEVLTRSRVEELHLKLWLSGRFSNIQSRLVPPEQAGDMPSVVMELKEYDKAPKLIEPLSEAEQVMLRFHQWASQLSESDETLLLELPSCLSGVSCLIAPTRGFLVRIGDHQVLVHSGRIVCCAGDRRQKLVIPTERLTLAAMISIDSREEDQKDTAHVANICFSLQTEFQPPGSPPRPVALGTTVNPSTCLALVDSPDARCSLADGVLSVISPRGQTEIDAPTGRLLKGVAPAKDGGKGAAFSVAPEKFESVCRDLEQSWHDYPDYFIPTAPVSSTLRFVAADPVIRQYLLEKASKRKGRPVDDDQLAVILKLLDEAVLPTADEICERWRLERQNGRKKFAAYGQDSLYSDLSTKAGPSTIAALTLAALDLFPIGTWPYHCIGAAGSAYAKSEALYRFHAEPLFASSTKSPVRDMLMAAWFQGAYPQTANQLAWRGLVGLTEEAFLEDRAVLLDEGQHFGRFAIHVAETLQDLTDEEAEALLDACFGGPEPGLVTGLQYLRLHRDRPARDVLPDAVEVAWETSWRDAVKARLSEIVIATGGQARPGGFEWDFGQAGEKPEKTETRESPESAEAPFEQRAQKASKPLWESLPKTQSESDVSQSGSRFELQGPFSK